MNKRVVISVEQAIGYLDGKKSSGDMSADDAIIITARRQGRPHEDDWEIIEAAEVLAREVADLRSRIELARVGF